MRSVRSVKSVKNVKNVKNVTGKMLAVFAMGAAVSGSALADASDLVLRYDKPGAKWTEALVLGNGRLGGMVWGGVEKERIQLNEDTLWSGEPRVLQRADTLAALPEIRKLLLEGKTKAAADLVNQKMLGPWNQSYMPLGDLLVEFDAPGAPAGDYRRELDLRQGIARVTYRCGAATFTREVFASFPDQVIVMRLTCDQPGKISFTAKLASQIRHKTTAAGDRLVLTGKCPKHVEPNYQGDVPNPVVYDDAPDGKGMRFETHLRAQADGGKTTVTDQSLRVEGANAVTLLLTAATSFNGPHKSPSAEGKNPRPLCERAVSAAAGKSYLALREAHVADFRALFDRVELDLGQTDASRLPTDQRIREYAPGKDPALAALYFQFGRYLLISSSRPGTQPANLQGIWNEKMRPDWSANWTLNCNVEINYWPVEVANLPECHLPLADMIEGLKVDGARTSKVMYGARGWMAHHNADIWLTTPPVGGTGLWAIYQVGSGWLCHHLWEHYAFTGDREFLKRVYPTLRDAALFYMDTLIEERHGWLVTAPATSFESSYRKPDGEVNWVCMGPTMDMQIVRDLYQNVVEASKILGEDAELRARLEKDLKRLAPNQVSPTTGRLQEWSEDWENADPRNGQVAQGWGLVPGSQIHPRRAPDLAAAMRKTLEFRRPWETNSCASWTGSWAANMWARLGDGDKAAMVLDTHFKQALNPNLSAHFMGGVDWEIDGNLGITAAIAEMLLQSHEKKDEGGRMKDEEIRKDSSPYVIELLPALPKAWAAQGSVKGLKARGNVTVDIEWKNGKVTNFKFRSPSPKPVAARINGESKTITPEKLQ